MNVFWLYRVFTFVVASVLSLVVIGLCRHTDESLKVVLQSFGDDPDGFPYTTLGIAVAVVTLASYIIMLALDFFLAKVFTSMIIFELAWSSILWVLWIAVGATTLSEGSTIFQGHPCAEFDLIQGSKAADVCNGIHPLASVAFVTYAFLFLYCGVLLFAAFRHSGSTPAWTTSLKDRGKF